MTTSTNNTPKMKPGAKMRVISLCTGIGGDVAAFRQAGISHEMVAMAEFDPLAASVLAQKFPDIRNLGDITAIDHWKDYHGQVDLLIAGIPCQPYSAAGRQRGTNDKGGVGKSFVSALVADLMEINGRDFRIVQIDEQDRLPSLFGDRVTTVAPARLDVRQREAWARDAVAAFGRGEADKALAAFAGQKLLLEADGEKATVKAVVDRVDQYLGSQKPNSFLIIAKTNTEVAAISREVRTRLREKQLIRGEDISIDAVTPSGHANRIDIAAGDQIRFLVRNDRVGVINGTGQPISVVRDAYRFVRFEHRWFGFPRRPPIMGTTSEELASVLRLFGFDGHWEYHTDKPTLAAYLKARQGYCRTHPTAVFFGRHVVAIKGWEFCDTFTDGQVVEADDAPHRRKRVKAVFVITEQIAPKTFPRKWIL